MIIEATQFRGRRGWCIRNDRLALTVLQGGGHLARLVPVEGPALNPYWEPVWKGLEPWDCTPRHARQYENRLLASICGHNLCLGWFGSPSPEEEQAGLGLHGEASVARWRVMRRHAGPAVVRLTVGCTLPGAGMTCARTITLRRGSHTVEIEERVRNTLRRDVPYTMCQHVTLGPPFLEKGKTVFDASATRGHTFPRRFGDGHRLKPNAPFRWPLAPGARGQQMDVRVLPARVKSSCDFTTQLMDPRREDAWFSALHPGAGLMLAYHWEREDYPWLGSWEENHSRIAPPWNGKSLARGMEFANTPFPTSLRDAVERGSLFGTRTFDWLPARGSRTYRYALTYQPCAQGARGVKDVRREKNALVVEVAGRAKQATLFLTQP